MEPDQIDMMNENELRIELRNVLINLNNTEKENAYLKNLWKISNSYSHKFLALSDNREDEELSNLANDFYVSLRDEGSIKTINEIYGKS